MNHPAPAPLEAGESVMSISFKRKSPHAAGGSRTQTEIGMCYGYLMVIQRLFFLFGKTYRGLLLMLSNLLCGFLVLCGSVSAGRNVAFTQRTAHTPRILPSCTFQEPTYMQMQVSSVISSSIQRLSTERYR